MFSSWFTAGYNDAKAGKAFMPPENSHARDNYRMGYEAAQQRIPFKQAAEAAGYSPKGKKTP